jgi:hypothetical protein
MRRNSLAWIVIGGCAFGLASMELAACSSDGGGTGTPLAQPDATSNKDGQSSGGDGSTKNDGSSSKDGGVEEAAVDCGKAPTLHPRAIHDAGPDGDSGPFENFLCPFAAASGQPFVFCDDGMHCCVPFSGQSSCETSCPAAGDGGPFNGRDFECLDPVDCNTGGAAGPVCCGTGQVVKDEACGDYFGKSFKGTKCAASCDDSNNEFVICQSDDQCSGGKTCVAMSAVGAQFGFCQ